MSPHGEGGGRLRVLVLVDGLIAGGGERFARQLTSRLHGDRFERTLCVTRWSDTTAAHPAAVEALDELRASGVEFLGLRRPSRVSLGAWRPLLRLLRAGRVDILHAHKFGSNFWAAALARLARPPVLITHEHTWSYQGKPWRRFLDRELIARTSDAFIAVSSEDRRRMIEVERIDPQKIVLMVPAIPTPPSPRPRDVRAELGIAAEDPVVGTVCALRPQKALEVLLRAAATLRTEFPGLRVLIVGDGPERERLESAAASLGLGETVQFLGQRTDVLELLTAFDVAASSSDFEGSPLAMMEWMEAGLPVVATRVGGVPDLFDEGREGLLVAPGDPRALAAAIGELLRDPARARELGRKAQERRRREFDLEAVVAKTEALYERLYAASPRADRARVRR
jgi:glycosyltransferase involved in cell wall biosynthesis